jgi:hypothetical protein
VSAHILRQSDELAVGRRDNGYDPAVDPDLATRLFKRANASLAFERRVPAPGTNRDHRTAERRNAPTLAKPHDTNARYGHLRLQLVKPQRTVAVRELQHLPS